MRGSELGCSEDYPPAAAQRQSVQVKISAPRTSKTNAGTQLRHERKMFPRVWVCHRVVTDRHLLAASRDGIIRKSNLWQDAN